MGRGRQASFGAALWADRLWLPAQRHLSCGVSVVALRVEEDAGDAHRGGRCGQNLEIGAHDAISKAGEGARRIGVDEQKVVLGWAQVEASELVELLPERRRIERGGAHGREGEVGCEIAGLEPVGLARVGRICFHGDAIERQPRYIGGVGGDPGDRGHGLDEGDQPALLLLRLGHADQQQRQQQHQHAHPKPPGAQRQPVATASLSEPAAVAPIHGLSALSIDIC